MFKKLELSKPNETSSQNLTVSESRQLCSPQIAAERAAILFGCYRKGDANDPETYTAAITAILAEYPEEVVRIATDPRTGIARKTNWLPTVAEVDQFCKTHHEIIKNRDELLRRGWRFADGKWIKPEAA